MSHPHLSPANLLLLQDKLLQTAGCSRYSSVSFILLFVSNNAHTILTLVEKHWNDNKPIVRCQQVWFLTLDHSQYFIYKTIWYFHGFQKANHSSYNMVGKNAEKLGKHCKAFLIHEIWETNTLGFGHWPGQHSKCCFIAFFSPFFVSSQYFHCSLWSTCWSIYFLSWSPLTL